MRTFNSPLPNSLSERQRRFAEVYVLENNGAASARAAGYAHGSAKVAAARLLRRVDVQAYLQILRADLEAKRAEMRANPPVTAEWIAARYQAMASVSAADLWIREGSSRRQKRPDELTDNERAAIASLKIIPAKLNKDGTTTEQQFQYRLYNQAAALKALSRLLGVDNNRPTRERQCEDGPSFDFTVSSEATSETVARLRAKYGNAGARIRDVEPKQIRLDKPIRD
jgi:phage terminase small subunit